VLFSSYYCVCSGMCSGRTETLIHCRLHLKCDGKHAETRFRVSAKRMSPLKLSGASVQSTTGSQGAGISGSNAGYTMFRGSVKSTGYSLRSPVSPSLPLLCVTVCHHISAGPYLITAVYCIFSMKYVSTVKPSCENISITYVDQLIRMFI
jgi:hypothetical protein